MDTTTASPAPAADAPAPAGEAEATAGQVALGTGYTDAFTLEQAVASYNRTREAYPGPDGRTVTAEAQHIKPDEAWFRRHAGAFRLRRPSHYDELAMRVRYDQLAGPRPDLLAAYTRWLVDATVVAETLLVEAPKWFTVATCKDPDVLPMIHHWYSEWNARFRDEGSSAS